MVGASTTPPRRRTPSRKAPPSPTAVFPSTRHAHIPDAVVVARAASLDGVGGCSGSGWYVRGTAPLLLVSASFLVCYCTLSRDARRKKSLHSRSGALLVHQSSQATRRISQV